MKTESTQNPGMLTANAVGESIQQTDVGSVGSGGDPPDTPDPPPMGANELALEQHRAEFQALPDSALVTANVDIAQAAMLVLSVSQTWEPYKQRIATLSMEVNHELIAKIVGFAEATLQTVNEVITTTAAANGLHEALQEGTRLRERLLLEANVLVQRGLLPDTLDQIDRAPGYRNVGVGLSAIASVLRRNWSKIRGKTAITSADLKAAHDLAYKIQHNAAQRELRDPDVAAARKLRLQGFSSLVHAYEEMQRCLAFLEPKLVAVLAPSLYEVRGRSSGTQDTIEPDPTPNPELPVTPVIGTSGAATTTATTLTGPNGLVVPSPFR